MGSLAIREIGMSLEAIPRELFEIIQEFATPLYYWRLISLSKSQFFQEIQFLTRRIFLKAQSLREFLSWHEDDDVIDDDGNGNATTSGKNNNNNIGEIIYLTIIKKVANPSKQLFFNFDFYYPHQNNLLGFNELKSMEFYYRQLFTQLPFKPTHLELSSISSDSLFSSSNGIPEEEWLQWFQSLTSLKIANTFELRSFSGIKNQFNDLLILELENCFSLEDLSPLAIYAASLKELRIKTCSPEIRDISCFNFVRKLVFIGSSYSQTIEIGLLGNIDWLEIHRCTITDKNSSVLKKNKTLIFVDCQRNGLTSNPLSYQLLTQLQLSNHLVTESNIDYKDFINLGLLDSSSLKSLKLINSDLAETHFFRSLHILHLEGCEITELIGLRKVPVLRIKDCEELRTISDLGENLSVVVSLCGGIRDFSALQCVPRVTIESCVGFKDANDLAFVDHLTIINCSNLYDFKPLSKVYRLELIGCFGFSSFSGLNRVSILKIASCHQCNSLEGFESTFYQLHFDAFGKRLFEESGLAANYTYQGLTPVNDDYTSKLHMFLS